MLNPAAAMSRIGSESAFEVLDSAMQLHGGYGYSSDLPLERMLRDVRAFKIGGGTTQMFQPIAMSMSSPSRFSFRPMSRMTLLKSFNNSRPNTKRRWQTFVRRTKLRSIYRNLSIEQSE